MRVKRNKPRTSKDKAIAALRHALQAFVDYYEQAGIGDAKETDCDEGRFDNDERFNVRWGRKVLAETKGR